MKITVAKLVAEVRRLATTYPLNNYNPISDAGKCCYAAGSCSNGSCGCIIGQALLNLGIERTLLIDFDAKSHGGISKLWQTGRIRDLLFEEGEYTIPDNDIKIDWLQLVQSDQDSKRCWGDAITNANRELTITV